ncbi:MAG: glycosyltransferase [Pseudomonadota bacterium]
MSTTALHAALRAKPNDAAPGGAPGPVKDVTGVTEITDPAFQADPDPDRPRLLLIVHQFFPQFHSGTETLCERCARAYVAMGFAVDIVTSVMVDEAALPPLLASDVLDAQTRAVLEAPEPPLTRQIRYAYAPHIDVHAFTHSHDPRHGRPRFLREVTEPAIEALFDRLSEARRYQRAIVFHLLHVPLKGLAGLAARGIPISFVATDFFAVCPIGSQQFEDGRLCRGPGPMSLACVRHLSTGQEGWLGWVQRINPTLVSAFYLWIFQRLGPWARLPVHPWQNLYFLVERNRASRAFLRTCDVVIAPSSRVAESLATAGLQKNRIRRLPYGMPPPRQATPPDRLAQPGVRLCYAAQISPRKGLNVLLDALERLPESLEWQLDIWGDVAQGGRYAAQQAARINGFCGRVRLLGTFASYRIHAVLGGYDYVVLPSTWSENLPLVLLSALQIGQPVIVSDARGLLDAFPDGRVHGRRFRMGDAADLARVLEEEIRGRPAYDPSDAPHIPSVEEFAIALLGR